MIIKGNTVGHPLPDPRKGLSMEGGIHMNGQVLTGIGTPVENADAVNLEYFKRVVDPIGTVQRIEKTLTAEGWAQSETAGFVQTVTVDGMSDEKKVRVYPAPPGALEAKLALAEEMPKVKAATRDGDLLTFEAWEEKPEIGIPVIVEVVT